MAIGRLAAEARARRAAAETIGSFLIPRKHRGGFRRADPALSAHERVQSHTFSQSDLNAAVGGPVTCEFRGSCGQKAPPRPGDLARSFFGAVTRW